MTFHMVIYTGSPAGDLRITAELWVNQAFVPAVSCHDAFEQSGIVFMRAPCVRTHHRTLRSSVRTHIRSRDRKIHQSLSHAEDGSLKEGVSSLSLTASYFLSHPLVSLSVLSTHTSFFLFLSPPGHPCVAWPSSGRLLAFNGPAGGRGSGCYQARPDGRVYPGIGDSVWGKTHWPYWWLWQQTWALWEAVSPQLQLPPWSQMLISCL